MSSAQSRFNPPNRHWYEDLPDSRAAFGRDIDSPTLGDDINAVNDGYLEVSRAGNVIRGGLLLMGAVVLVFFAWVMMHLIRAGIGPDDALIFPIISWTFLTIGTACAISGMVLDCSIPRDMPVRFDRGANKVHAYDYPVRLMPFPPRRAQMKTFSWHDVEAEITKQSGYNGKAYVIRYALVLVICKPGTNQVIDRLTLKGNDMTVRGLQAMWNYIRRYMAEGAVNLPPVQARVQGVSLRRSLFSYMPYFDPSAEGAHFRDRMGAVDWVLALFMMWFFWIWLPLGLCHYIAMKFAPVAQWPAELDTQGRREPASANPG